MLKALDKYLSLAKEGGMADALAVTPADICFDSRAILKCSWGCSWQPSASIKCAPRGTSPEERIGMVRKYSRILLLHSHDDVRLSQVLLELERTAFLDGFYFAFAVRYCRLCQDCAVDKGKACLFPSKVRPCETMFGIDVYRTVRQLGLPCDVLQQRDAPQNRYGFLLMD